MVAARDERIIISVLDLVAVGRWKSRAVPRRALAEITTLSKAIIGIKVWKGKIVYGITFNGLCALDVYYEYILFCLLVHPDSPVDTGQLTLSQAEADIQSVVVGLQLTQVVVFANYGQNDQLASS